MTIQVALLADGSPNGGMKLELTESNSIELRNQIDDIDSSLAAYEEALNAENLRRADYKVEMV